MNSPTRANRFVAVAAAMLVTMAASASDPAPRRFAGVDLTLDAKNVLQSLAVSRREVRSSDNHWFSLTCLPYRTTDNKIDGVVLTFNDVTALKQSEISMSEAPQKTSLTFKSEFKRMG